MKQQLNQPEVANEESPQEETPAVAVSGGRNKPYDLESVKVAWNQYIGQMEAAGKSQEMIILKENYELRGSEIILSITNAALEPTFEKVRADLLKSLRNSIENDSLTLRSQVVELDKSKMLYTDQEKFEHLKKKFPALKDLQEKLGLDPEF